MSKRNLRPIKLGLVVGSREFFNGRPALETRRQLLKQLDQIKVASAHPPGRGDQERRRAVARGRAPLRSLLSRAARRDRRPCNLPTELSATRSRFPNSSTRRALASRSSCRRATTKSTRSTSRAAGTPSAASSPSPTISTSTAFRSRTRPATPATSMAPSSRPTSTGLSGSAGSSAASNSARIGSIGARTGAFQTMRFSEKLLQASGLTVVTVDLSEIIFAANALADDASEVKAKLDGNLQPTVVSPRTSSQRRLSSKPSGRSQSIAGSKRTNATRAPSSAGAACRTISAARPA